MATLGTYYVTNTSGTGFANRVSITLEETATSTADNTSTITYTVKMGHTTSTSTGYYATTTGQVYINGTEVASWSASMYKNKATIATGTITVAHDSDGTKTLSTSASVYWHTSGHTGTYTNSTSYALTQIMRASVITAVSPTSVNIGSAVTLSITTYDASFTETLTYDINGTTGTITNPWTVPLTVYAALGSAASATATITLTTTDDGETIGTSSAEVTVYALPPTVQITNTFRCASDGTAQEDGTYVSVTVSYNLRHGYNASSTLVLNADSTDYSVSISTASGTVTEVIGGALSAYSQYTITATITDYYISQYNANLGTVAVTKQLSSMVMPLSLYDDGSSVGAAVGRAATEAGVFRCALPATFSGTVSGESVFSGMGFELGYGLSMGGYVDFHYNDPTLSSDFSSRLQGTTEGVIYVNSIYDSFLGMGRYSRASDTSLTVTFEEDHHALVMVDSTDLWLVHNDGGTLSAGHIFGSTSATFTHTAATSTTTESMTITLTSSALITALVL